MDDSVDFFFRSRQPNRVHVKVSKIALQDARCVPARIDTNEHCHSLTRIGFQQLIDPRRFRHRGRTTVRAVRIAKEEQNYFAPQLLKVKRFSVLVCQPKVNGRVILIPAARVGYSLGGHGRHFRIGRAHDRSRHLHLIWSQS